MMPCNIKGVLHDRVEILCDVNAGMLRNISCVQISPQTNAIEAILMTVFFRRATLLCLSCSLIC